MADRHTAPGPGTPAGSCAAGMGQGEPLELGRAAGNGELPALVLIRALVPAFLEGRSLDEVLAGPDERAAPVLHAVRQWAADSPLASLAPVVLAAGAQAVGALSHSFASEVDLPGLRRWFTVKADTVRAAEQLRGVEGAVVVAMRAELVEDLVPGPRREPDPAAEVLAAWAAPGADLYELMVSSAWFGLVHPTEASDGTTFFRSGCGSVSGGARRRPPPQRPRPAACLRPRRRPRPAPVPGSVGAPSMRTRTASPWTNPKSTGPCATAPVGRRSRQRDHPRDDLAGRQTTSATDFEPAGARTRRLVKQCLTYIIKQCCNQGRRSEPIEGVPGPVA